MKTDRKRKAGEDSPQTKTARNSRRPISKSKPANGKHPPVTYEHAPIGIVEASLEGKYINVNEEFCRMMGYDKKEVLRRGIKDFTHEDDYAIDVTLHEKLVEGKIPFYRLEKRYIHKEGREIWVELTRSIVRDTEGKPLYTVGVVLDISDRKDVERVLRESVERLRLATEAAQMFTWEWDFQRRVYTLADSFEQVLGFSGGLLPQNRFETVGRLMPREDVQQIAEAYQNAIASQGDLHALVCRAIDPETGRTVWLEISAKIVYDEEKNPVRMFGVAQNITQSKQAQDEIAIISRFPAENPNPILRLTPDGDVLFANEPGQDLLQDWKHQNDQKIPDELQKAVNQAFRSGSRMEVEIEHQGMFFSCTLAPILEAGYVNFYGNDITERKMAEVALQLARRQAEQAADRTARLQKVTAALSAAITPLQVAEVLASEGALALDAVSSSMMLLSEDGETLEILHSTSSEDIIRPYKLFPISLQVPAADAVRSGEPVWIETREQYLQRYPHLADQIAQWGQQAGIAIPMLYKERILGVLTMSFDRVLPYNLDDRDYVQTLARQGAQALKRARAEDALRESEERFRALVSQTTAGIAESNMDSVLIFANPRFCEMLGYTEGELLGKTIWELTHPDDLAENKRLFEQMLSRGESYQFEKRFIRKDGSGLWTNVTVSSILDLEGNPKGGVGVIVDIEGRKQAEAALAEYAREQGALYRLVDQLHRTVSFEDIFNAALDAIVNALQCDRASILLFDDAHVMRFVAWRRLSDAYRKATEGHSPWTPDAVNPAPLAMDNVDTAELDDALRAVIKGEGIGALAFIPLISNGRLIGKFMTYFNTPHSFTEEELDLSLTIARQLAFGVDRKRAEEKLRESEERYRAVVESQSEMLCRFRPDGTFLFVNSAYARARGTTAEELINHSFWEFVTEADRSSVQAMLASLTPEAPEVRIENRFQTARGERWTLWTNRALKFDSYGHVLEAQSSGIDITDRKRAEEALRESEERYRFIVENTSDGIWWIELTEPMPLSLSEDEQVDWYSRYAVIRQCNLGLARMYGYRSAAELAGKPLRDFMPREDPVNQDMLRQFIRSNYRLVDAESREVGDDGRELVFLNNMVGIVENGKLKGEWGTNRDITERKRAEEALRESEERYRGIVNQTIAGIAETDLTGKFIMVNNRYCEITAHTREELLHDMRMQDITHPDDLQTSRELFGRLTTDGAPFELEKRYVRPDGSIVWVHNSVSAITGADGRPSSAVAAVLDVTERRRAEETLRRNEELFSTLVEAAPFGVYFIDSEFRLRAINKGSEAVFAGIDPLIGRDFAEILRIVWEEPFATEAIERFQHTLRTGESFIAPPVTEQRGNIEEIQSYDWQIHRIIMPDGTYGVVCYFYDLSEQKQMEARVRASEQLYRAIASNIPGGGVYVVDKNFHYLIAEGPVTGAFGLTREMLEGRSVIDVFPDERGERMVERLQRSFAGETVSFETQLGGRTYWTRIAPLHDSLEQAIILSLDITERKQAEEALRESEERFALFMHHLPGLAWIKDRQGRYVYVNAAAEKAFSISREKLYGKTDKDIFPEDVAAQFKRNDERALADGQGVQAIETLRHNDGVLHYSLVSKFPIPGPDGSAALIGGTGFDITERLQAEEALRESEERFRAILRQATAGIVRKDADGRLIFVNQAFCNMLGYTEAELLGKTMWDLMHEEDIAESKASYDRMIMEGTPFKLERRLRREDGSMIWVDASVSPIMDAQGKPQSAVAVEVDITGRKQAEEALHQLNLQLEERVLSRTAKLRSVNQTLREEIAERRRVEEALRQSEAVAQENEAKLRSLFDLLPVGISFLDLNGQVVQTNSGLLNILQLTKEEMLKQTPRARKYIRADGTPMQPAELASARAIAENRTVYNVETGVVLENGEVIWTSVSAAPVEVADVSVIVVTVDITENKRAERALQESHARLRVLSQRLVEVQEEERRALARELHDRVGQTLAALNINLIIINSQLSPDVSEQIGTRLNDSMKLVAETIALVRDVMTDLRPAVLDDYGLEAALESHVAQYTARYDIKVKFEKSGQPIPRLGPSIEMTFLRITQEALMNIARHAQATQVNLSLRKEENEVCLTIQDNGVGIQSLQEANRPGSHGLTIMRERAEAFGGALRVRSVPGQGTTIEASIPLQGRNNTSQEMNL